LIVEIEYLPLDWFSKNPVKKYSIIRVRCRDNYQRQFIIEIQTFWVSDFNYSFLFHGGKAYVNISDATDDYLSSQPVYTLALVYKNFSKSKHFYHHYQIVSRLDTKEVIPGLEFVFIELTDKFNAETLTDRKMMVLWLRFLMEINEKISKLPPEMQENEHIRQAADQCKLSAFSPEDMRKYESDIAYIRIGNTLRDGTRRDGVKEGKAAEKEEAVVRGYNKGFSIDTIADFTELSTEQIIHILQKTG